MIMFKRQLQQLKKERESITSRQKFVAKLTFITVAISMIVVFFTKSSIYWCFPFVLIHLIAYRLFK